ncbi:hypothetical protein DYB38_012463 [Aphanomyces astaci]|uniref:Helitron helicase-like domain-containing protein n=1 Tax=Aphanomyces astaci TaxID=112090 RepID=A0A397CEP0_APHAT|nr:hypothetical protein DYB38_012463 [Aphanomyces astaci]
MESPEQHALRLQQLKAKRVMESPEEHTERLRKLKALRDMEAPEARATRLQNLKAQRDMESSEKHRARLDNLKAQRSVESADERAVRLSKHKNKRKLELQEDRAVRLKAMNLQHAAQRSVESSDARSRRLGYLKAQRKALRVSESVEEREGRLQRRRQGHHRVQQAKNDEVTASEAQCSALDDAGLLHECSKDMKSEILRQLGFALGPSGMDQCVCCVCDRLSFVTDVHMHSTADKGILQSMAARLRNPEVQLSDDLVAYYDCKDIHPAFVGLMLSRKGITHAGNVNDIENPSDVDFNVCLECETVLLQPWRSELPRHYVFPGEPVDSERGIQVKSLFDVQYLKHMPDKATMQQLAMNDNMASATLFDRSIEAFIKVVVGFDKSTGRPRKTGGLFGHVKAYFGMVETQGRGTLHLHLLVWVHGAPRSTSEYEARFQADLNYEAMVLKYSEGIVSNSLPIDLLETPCKTCEHADPKYEALDPPLTAFEKPRRSEGVLPKEPIMAKCGHCNTMVSSQHLVRQALLHSRPKVWPVELPKLSQPAIDKYLDEEASFLKSTAGKKYDPERTHDHMRASFQTYLAGTVHMESNVDYQELLAGARASLEESNTASNTYVAPDKDTFCLDPIYRELSSMPFGPNETRLPDETVLFVIATLASVLQVHWWSHCSSCFKQSRNTRGAQMCRYLFPRARVEVGRIGTSAILLVRKLGEEYINGYSDVILRAFKCNHDIQIMIGGAEMAERIYYACKYTTKDQQKVECRTALALAAFDTRIQRELSTAESGEALSDEVKCRRRLASHMFNMTRKQEVAGPLCAL